MDDVSPHDEQHRETEAERRNRNYNELLSIAFQQRFTELNSVDLDLYVASLLCAAIAALLLIAPAAAHRLLFRRKVKEELVRWTSVLASLGLAFLFLAMFGSIALILDVVVGATVCIVVTSTLAVAAAWVWYLHPLRWRRRSELETPPDQ